MPPPLHASLLSGWHFGLHRFDRFDRCWVLAVEPCVEFADCRNVLLALQSRTYEILVLGHHGGNCVFDVLPGCKPLARNYRKHAERVD